MGGPPTWISSPGLTGRQPGGGGQPQCRGVRCRQLPSLLFEPPADELQCPTAPLHRCAGAAAMGNVVGVTFGCGQAQRRRAGGPVAALAPRSPMAWGSGFLKAWTLVVGGESHPFPCGGGCWAGFSPGGDFLLCFRRRAQKIFDPELTPKKDSGPLPLLGGGGSPPPGLKIKSQVGMEGTKARY